MQYSVKLGIVARSLASHAIVMHSLHLVTSNKQRQAVIAALRKPGSLENQFLAFNRVLTAISTTLSLAKYRRTIVLHQYIIFNSFKKPVSKPQVLVGYAVWMRKPPRETLFSYLYISCVPFQDVLSWYETKGSPKGQSKKKAGRDLHTVYRSGR